MAAPIALQLYTVRDDLARDFDGTLARVAEIGYAGVEFAGFNGLPASKISKMLRHYNLTAAGAHIPYEDLETDLEAVVEYNLEIDNKYLIVPAISEDRRKDRKKWRSFAHQLNEIGRDIEDYGLKIGYHNHAFEFEDYGGQTGWEILLEELDANVVVAEIDTYWIQYGGADPVEWIKQFAGRCPLIHLKDMADDADRSCTEIGAGTLNLDAIFEAAEAGGIEWYIVEQDTCAAHPPLESARISFENLKARGKV
jgi:sugar phosphate isomerase/epimerase